MPADADVEGGYGAGGVGAGMGSGHGNGNQNGGGNPADANNPGIGYGIQDTSGAVDTGFDFDNWGGIGIQGASTNQQHPGSHPDQNPANNPGIGYGIQDVDIDVDYGYYDSPIENYSGQSLAMQDLNYDAVENAMRSPAIRGYRSPHQSFTGYGNLQDGYSPMGYSGVRGRTGLFGPSQEETEAIAMNAANAAISRALGMDEAEARARTSTALGTMEQDAAINLSAPAATNQDTFDADLANTTGATLDDTDFDDDLGFATQTTAPTTAPVVDPVKQEMQFDFKNFYSALDDEDATEKAKALEVQGFLDHINRKNYTDTGLLSRLGIRSPQLTEREQIAQVKNFLGKHQESIDALNKAYSKQINENPGLRQVMPGYKAITGLMSLIGLEPQHVHPSVQALYDKMVDLGLMERETPEMTEAKKIKQCNSTTGYRWDTEKNACVPINQDSDGSYNPYLGILG